MLARTERYSSKFVKLLFLLVVCENEMTFPSKMMLLFFRPAISLYHLLLYKFLNRTSFGIIFILNQNTSKFNS